MVTGTVNGQSYTGYFTQELCLCDVHVPVPSGTGGIGNPKPPSGGTLQLEPIVTPEPSSLFLFGTGLIALAGIVRKRSRLV